MKAELERRVRHRANDCCEYCLIPADCDLTPHHIDHVIAEKHRGKTHFGNLAVACSFCNTYKGPNIAGMDPTSRALTRLFNPRKDRWGRHFRLRHDGWILGKSSVGRTTVDVLRMNEPESTSLRATLIAEGVLFFGN